MKKLFLILLFLLLSTGISLADTPVVGSGGFAVTSVTNSISGTRGGMLDTAAEATATLSGASTSITVAVPASATSPVEILGVQLWVETANVTYAGGAYDWGAAFTGGSTAVICSSQNSTIGSAVNSMQGGVVTATTNVNIIAQIAGVASGTFTGGVIRAIVYYRRFL